MRREGLAIGLVDYKICAVNETWSGLRFAPPQALRSWRGLTAGMLALALATGLVALPVRAAADERAVVCRMACADQDGCCCKPRDASASDGDADRPSIGAPVDRCPEGCSLPAGSDRAAKRANTADRFATHRETPRDAANIDAGETIGSLCAVGAADPRAPPSTRSLR